MPVVYIVNKDGVATTSIQAGVEEISEELNKPEETTVSLGLEDLSHANFRPGEDEIYFEWEAERYWGRGTWAEADFNEGKLHIHCSGLAEYFDHRFFGEALPDVFGVNMSFEDAENLNSGGGWSTVGAPSTSATRVASELSGAWGADLFNSNAPTVGFMKQAATSLPTINANIFLSAWLKCDPAGVLPTTYGGNFLPAMTLAVKDAGGTTLGSVKSSTILDPNIELGKWMRVECPPLYLPANSFSIEWFLFAPGGHVIWDEVRLTVDPMLDWQGIEVATIVRNLAQYAQGLPLPVNVAKPDWPTLKSDLNISTSIVPTGRTRWLRKHLFERGSVGAEIAEWTERDDGVEVWMTHNRGAGSRTFHIANRRGADKSATVELRAGDDVTDPNCEATGNALIDGRNLANAVVFTASGTGPTREFGWANDGRPPVGSLPSLPPEESAEVPDLTLPTLEAVVSAPQGVPIDGLMNKALAYMRANADVATLPELRVGYDQEVQTTGAAVFARTLDVGDTIAVNIRYGWFIHAGDVRIVKRVVNLHDKQITFTINPTTTRGAVRRPTFPAIIDGMRKRLEEVERTRFVDIDSYYDLKRQVSHLQPGLPT